MTAHNHFKRKLRFITIGSILLFLGVGCIIAYNMISIQQNSENKSTVDRLLINLSDCKSATRSFLLNAWSDTSLVKNGTNEDVKQFDLHYAQIAASTELFPEDSSFAVSFITEISQLKSNFDLISISIKERGFKDLGLEGQLRSAAHQLEKSPAIFDKALILTLRKHEKDFFLRRDKAYIEKFNTDLAKLKSAIETLPASQRESLTATVNQYEICFQKIAKLEETIGLTKDLGLRKRINLNIQNAASYLEDLRERIEIRNERTYNFTITFIIMTIAAMLLAVLWGITRFIKPVFEPMADIQERANEISEGNLTVSFEEFRKNIVLKDLIGSLEKIIQKFKTTMTQVEGISNRTLKETISIRSGQDEIGITLNKILQQANEIDEEEERRNWHNEGIAIFGQSLRTIGNHGNETFQVITGKLVQYVQALQGALFILNDSEEEHYLEMKGCFAVNPEDLMGTKIYEGESTVGICWKTKESIQLNQVPGNYINISSGLGKNTAHYVLLVPLLYNDMVLGVLEIACFRKFMDHEIKFIESIAALFGSEIQNLKISFKNKEIYEHSQLLAAELQEQQEELRQNIEELQATQDVMNKRSA